MTLHSIIFYIISAVILISTGLAVTRRNLVHAIIYLVISFFGSALLFYLFGAPLLAALEVIIYAGAIMILFLFILMMLKVEGVEEKLFPLKQWLPAMGLSLVTGSVTIMFFLAADSASQKPLKTALADPQIFGNFLFKQHWLGIEIISLLLLIAVIGVLHLGIRRKQSEHGENRI